jgi:hypothetical protein
LNVDEKEVIDEHDILIVRKRTLVVTLPENESVR